MWWLLCVGWVKGSERIWSSDSRYHETHCSLLNGNDKISIGWHSLAEEIKMGRFYSKLKCDNINKYSTIQLNQAADSNNIPFANSLPMAPILYYYSLTILLCSYIVKIRFTPLCSSCLEQYGPKKKKKNAENFWHNLFCSMHLKIGLDVCVFAFTSCSNLKVSPKYS